MVSDHQKVIAAFDKQAKSGKDADLKAYASKMLPSSQSHLQMAKQVQAQAGSGSGASR